jgi:hypothetical protein
MTSTAALALHYGLRLDAAPEFVQGYADGMRLDQRGQGVACGAGWIPRTKKCSPDKAKQTSKEAKAKTVEKSKARAKLKGEVKAAKGQKAYVKPKAEPTSEIKPRKERKPRSSNPRTNDEILSEALAQSKKMKGKNQEVSFIVPSPFSFEKDQAVTGKAEVFGDFAIHPIVGPGMADGVKTFDPSLGTYQITHLPSGLPLATGTSKKNIKAAMYMLETMGAGERLNPTSGSDESSSELSARQKASRTSQNANSDPQFREALQGIVDIARRGQTERDLSKVIP